MSRWYRAYEGTTTDAKLGEVAIVASCSRSVAIATWHAILESCATTQDKGRFTTTARRVAAALGEPPSVIEGVFAGLGEVGMISGDRVCAWTKRQFESDNSTGRSRKHRQRQEDVSATLHQAHATSPSVCVSVLNEEEEKEKPEGEALSPARARLDGIERQISEAAGSMPVAVSTDISPIVRLLDAGWNLEGHILPGIRDMARVGKRAETWSYVAKTLVGRADAIRAGPPPPDKPESASDRFARKLQAKNGDSRTNPRNVYPAA